MAYSFQTFTLSQVLTAAQMNQVEVNIRDHAHGVAGVVTITSAAGFTAGVVDQAAIGAAAVGQGELKTTTGEVSTGGTTPTPLTLPGGEYGFFPQVRHSTGGGGGAHTVLFGNGTEQATGSTSYVTIVMLNVGSSGQAYAQQRYVQASPPYDLGNGDIPLFIFLAVRPDGSIAHGYLAEDPPWANNGPTDIRADYFRNGKAFQRRKVLPFTCDVFAKANAVEQQDLLLALADAADTEVEITQQIKQADMPLIPHPFMGATGLSIILIDPVSNLCRGLHELHASGESVLELFHGGNFILDNEAIKDIYAPPGVLPVKARWKLTP